MAIFVELPLQRYVENRAAGPIDPSVGSSILGIDNPALGLTQESPNTIKWTTHGADAGKAGALTYPDPYTAKFSHDGLTDTAAWHGKRLVLRPEDVGKVFWYRFEVKNAVNVSASTTQSHALSSESGSCITKVEAETTRWNLTDGIYAGKFTCVATGVAIFQFGGGFGTAIPAATAAFSFEICNLSIQREQPGQASPWDYHGVEDWNGYGEWFWPFHRYGAVVVHDWNTNNGGRLTEAYGPSMSTHNPDCMVILGDSVTAPVEAWPRVLNTEWADAGDPYRIVGLAHGGKSLKGFVNDKPQQLGYALSAGVQYGGILPGKLLVAVSANDFWPGPPPGAGGSTWEEALDNIIKLSMLAECAGMPFSTCYPTPFDETPFNDLWGDGIDGGVDEANTWDFVCILGQGNNKPVSLYHQGNHYAHLDPWANIRDGTNADKLAAAYEKDTDPDGIHHKYPDTTDAVKVAVKNMLEGFCDNAIFYPRRRGHVLDNTALRSAMQETNVLLYKDAGG